jgi:RNA polymerase sigma-70 factor, ECF subfamily
MRHSAVVSALHSKQNGPCRVATPLHNGSPVRPRTALPSPTSAPGSLADPTEDPSQALPPEHPLRAADAAMERYAEGEQEAFEIVYAGLAPRIVAFVRRYVRPESAVDDVVQLTFLNIHRGRGTFRRGGRVLPWAIAIARSVIRERWRQRPRLEQMITGEIDLGDFADPGAFGASGAVAFGRPRPCPPPSEAASAMEARELAWLAAGHLEQLAAGQRLAYELVKLEGLTHAEAAQVMGTTEMTIRLRVHRVVAGLRSLLERTRQS